MMRHFLDLKDFDKSQLQALLDYGIAVRADLKAGIQNEQPLAGQHIGMIFEKPSTRTRVSFEVGISQLGGTPIIYQQMICS